MLPWGRSSLWSAWLADLPAWLLSLCFHALLLIGLALVMRVSQRGATLEPARGGGIVLAADVDGETQYYGAAESATSDSAAAEDMAATRAAALPSGDAPPVDISGVLPSARGATAPGGEGDALPSASAFTGGARPAGGRVGGNQARTSIFGAEGTGNKFVYVFDRSASMDGYEGRPLAAAKRELVASLGDLDQIHQFQIVFYNEHPTVFNPAYPQPPRMLFGDSATKRLAQSFVRGIIAAGGTGHLAALKLALGMQPDVIFFLTDAGEPQLSASEMEEVRRRNARTGACLNVIEFGAGPQSGGANFLVRLAQQNGGRYVYVDVTRLPLPQGAAQ
ncbi:MAG: hypothetical protein MUF48_11455 [Pirellulaceae bacterium]|nr:hypothetical protein [Pirellulaceae bacterium]